MISVEEYLQTSVKTAGVTDIASNVGKYLKAHPWQTAGGALGLGALGGYGLGRAIHKEDPEEIKETPINLFPDMGVELAKGVGKGLGTEAVKGLGGAITDGIKSLIRSTKHKPTYEKAVATDPLLQEADPELLEESFKTMVQFAPTLATNPQAVQSFLREAVTSGGGVNYNTVKLLTDIEQSSQKK